MQQSKRPPGGGRGDRLIEGLGSSSLDQIGAAPQSPNEARLQHLAQRVHALGARVLAELLAEHLAQGGDLRARLERYASIDPADLVATGGDRFPRRLVTLKGGRA